MKGGQLAAMKLCKHCAHYRAASSAPMLGPLFSGACLRSVRDSVSPIDGQFNGPVHQPHTERLDPDPERCGLDAQFFQPKRRWWRLFNAQRS